MASLSLHGHFAFDGFAPPNQRYRIAKKFHDDGRPLPFGADKVTRRLSRFLRARDLARNSKSRILNDYADLVTAFSLRCRKYQSQRRIIEAYLVAKADSASIALRVGVPAHAIKSYSDVFYDVEEILKSPIRTLHELIGPFDGRNDFDWDVSRLQKWVGYRLGAPGLDEMFGIDGHTNQNRSTLKDVVAKQVRTTLLLKQLATMSQLNTKNLKHQELLAKLWSQDQSRQEKEGASLNSYEQHFKAMLEEIPWMCGSDAEELLGNTPLGKCDRRAAVLRDAEVQRIAAGETIDLDLPESLPPPRKRLPQAMDGGFAPGRVNPAPPPLSANQNIPPRK